MSVRRAISLCVVLACAGLARPASAGEIWQSGEPSYWSIRDAIYERVNMIDYFEANPYVDPTVKGPAITTAEAESRHLRAKLGPPLPPRYFVPCCYSRRPLYIR